jgi:hypothetical protein
LIVALLLSIVLHALLVYADGRRHERAVWMDWDALLTPRAKQALRTIEQRVRDEMDLVDRALRGACECAQEAAPEQARRLLDTGVHVLRRRLPFVRERLGRLALLARMSAAVGPVPALDATRLQLAPLRRAAQLHNLLREVLLSNRERLCLRSYVLRYAFAALARSLATTASRLAESPAGHTALWTTVHAGRSDLDTLTTEALLTLRVLLAALGGAPRSHVLLVPGDF